MIDKEQKLLNKQTQDVIDSGKETKSRRVLATFRCLQLIQTGLFKKEVRDIMYSEFPDLISEKGNAIKLKCAIADSYKIFQNNQIKSARSISFVHAKRYQGIINKLFNYDYGKLAPELVEGKKVENLLSILETMYAYQRLFQMHNRKFTIKLIQKNKKELDEANKLDLSKLSFDEQLEMMGLIQKMKEPKGINAEKIDFEEIDQLTEDLDN